MFIGVDHDTPVVEIGFAPTQAHDCPVRACQEEESTGKHHRSHRPDLCIGAVPICMRTKWTRGWTHASGALTGETVELLAPRGLEDLIRSAQR